MNERRVKSSLYFLMPLVKQAIFARISIQSLVEIPSLPGRCSIIQRKISLNYLVLFVSCFRTFGMRPPAKGRRKSKEQISERKVVKRSLVMVLGSSHSVLRFSDY